MYFNKSYFLYFKSSWFILSYYLKSHRQIFKTVRTYLFFLFMGMKIKGNHQRRNNCDPEYLLT